MENTRIQQTNFLKKSMEDRHKLERKRELELHWKDQQEELSKKIEGERQQEQNNKIIFEQKEKLKASQLATQQRLDEQRTKAASKQEELNKMNEIRAGEERTKMKMAERERERERERDFLASQP